MYDIEKYKETFSLDEALSYLDKNTDAKIISGGTDVLIRIREGKIKAAHLMGIGRIDSLKKTYKADNGDIHIGPLLTFSLIEKDPLLNKYLPSLVEAASSVGGPQIRNTATVGGNICNGATSADSASVLLTYNARFVIDRYNNRRVVPIDEFYLGPGKVVLEKTEILTDIIISEKDYKNYKGTFRKFSQRESMDIATLGCAVLAEIDNGIFKDIRIAFGVAAPTPVRCPAAEKKASGLKASRENIHKIAQAVLEDIKPRDSWRGSKEFRKHLAEVLTFRGLCKLSGLEEYEIE